MTELGTNADAWDGLPLTEAHAAKLAEAAISHEVASAVGIRSANVVADLPPWAQSWGNLALPAIVFPYRSPGGRMVEQVYPDVPIQYKDEPRPRKYLFQPDSGSVLNVVRAVPGATKALIVEGTKQGLAAASYAPDDWAVYGIAGCRNWSSEGTPIRDLEIVEGCEVVVILDADLASNLSVWEAGDRLARALDYEGAQTVKFAKLAGGAKSGLDDELAKARPERRAAYLSRLITKAGKLPGKPRGRAASPAAGDEDDPAEAVTFFDQTGLLVDDLCNAIRDRMPAALTEEQRVALYRNGFYNLDKSALIGAVAEFLGNRNRPGNRAAVEEHMIGQLFNAQLFLPTYSSEALLNCANGMLDLATAVLKPHDPAYLSAQQIPIRWDADAECPTYLQWAEKCGILGQLDDLEEAASAMLDPSRTPSKAVFLFGPSRSGKSTFLRLMQAVVGTRNLSSVTLHQLAQNRFMAANVFGKLLNCAADLSSAHVEDISIFKMMAGDDPIQADRKYGGQFSFTNRALFAFSANTLPTVGESSQAYVERIKPFEFPVSFAGHEDPSIEERMTREELPGILVRWVKAWQRKQARGGRYLPTDPRVLHEFEIRSDRVRQWADARCVIWTEDSDGRKVTHGSNIEYDRALTKTELAQAFNQWADDSKTAPLGMSKVVDRLLTIAGVCEVRRGPKRVRAINVTVREDDETPWDDEAGAEPPRADPEPPRAIPEPPRAIPEPPRAIPEPPRADPGDGIAREFAQVGEAAGNSGAVRAVFLDKPPTPTRRAISRSTRDRGTCVTTVGSLDEKTARSARSTPETADALFPDPAPAAPAERGPLQPTPAVYGGDRRPDDWVDLFRVDAPDLDMPTCDTCGAAKVPDAEMAYFLLCPVCTPGTLRPADTEVTK